MHFGGSDTLRAGGGRSCYAPVTAVTLASFLTPFSSLRRFVMMKRSPSFLFCLLDWPVQMLALRKADREARDPLAAAQRPAVVEALQMGDDGTPQRWALARG
jgi:hypothetical protein